MNDKQLLPELSNDDLAIIQAIKTLDTANKQRILDIIEILVKNSDNKVISSSSTSPADSSNRI
jgi:hypothetical protein